MDNFQEQTLRRVAGLDEKQTQVILHCANLADVHGKVLNPLTGIKIWQLTRFFRT